MLEIEGLSKRSGDVVALDGVTFSVPEGRVVGFLGPNGAGKTTTMRSVFGLTRSDEGTVRWRGGPIGPEDRARFGYLPEERGLYPKMPVGDQLVYLGRLHGIDKTTAGQLVTGWLDRVGLGDRASSPLEELSHGDQQRVQLLAALIHDPELLVCGDVRLRVPSDVDVVGLAESAGAAGGLEHFSVEPPGVSDLFREAVGR